MVSVQQSELGAKPGLVSDVIGAVTAHIRGNELMPGDRLPSEATLSKELNVSRTVVREALRSLAAMRIVELNAGKRATVAQLDHGPLSLLIEHGVHTEQINVQQIYDVRRTIEARIVALAALRRTDAEAAEIMRLAEAMRAAEDDPPTIRENDLAFHAAIARASKNPVFALIIGAFQGITRQTWEIGWRSRTTRAARDTMLSTHLAIAGAIKAGDPVEAARLMSLHFDESVRALLDAGLA
jgi:DNA-binding FadR family transcriptional regulator